MGSLDESKKKIELIHEAIHKLIDGKNKNGKEESEGEEEESILLSRLLSQLDSIEKEVEINNHQKNQLEKEKPSPSPTKSKECVSKDEEMNEIVKDLKILKRQNHITHGLLSVLIIVTAVWQFKEASLLLNLKGMVTNPMKAVGDMINDALKGKGKKAAIEAHPLPPIGVPELPHIDLPHLHLSGHEE